MSGTVNISRDIWHDAAFKDQPFTEREAFVWLIMEASWKDREKRVGNVAVSLKRGQLVASVRFMAEAWKWQKSTVDRFLKRLEKRDMIGTASGTGMNVVTICKYDEYQNGPNRSGTPQKADAGHQRDTSGTNEKKGLIPDASHKEEPNGSLAIADETAEAVHAYNEAANVSGWPKVQKLTTSRRSSLNARLREAGGIEGWRIAISKASASDFLCGRSGRDPFFASFDFLTRQSSFTKLMEGSYDNRDRPLAASSSPSGYGQGGSLASIAARRRASGAV